MSIYGSVSDRGLTLYTTDYEPRVLTDEDEPCGSGFVDVAVAASFHDKVRLIVEPSNVCLTADDARALALWLIVAADRAGGTP